MSQNYSDLRTSQLTYADALKYLFADARYDGRGPKYANPERSIERMRELLALLGNPHHTFQSVHITGTKGKGSTSAFTESILRRLGYRTGLFTSPHLHTFRERMRVDGELIGQFHLARLVERLRPQFEKISDLSVFDKITALAFEFFSESNVEWGIVEVGLGGRLDSTNVLAPAVCGITRISKDHTHILGDTLAQIAAEKAGIIKPETPVFIAPQKKSARVVLAETAEKMRAPVYWVTPRPDLPVPLLGRHQQVNATIAWDMATLLIDQGRIRTDPLAMSDGLARTWWPGRFEQLPGFEEIRPPLLVDSAHNVDSINLLLKTLNGYYPERPFTMIFGANRDKRMLPMLKRLLSVTDQIVLVQSRHPKALASETIRQEMIPLLSGSSQLHRRVNVQIVSTMTEALTAAASVTPTDGIMVGTGSVFVVAELREAWNQQYPGHFPQGDWVHEAAQEPTIG